MNPPRRKLSPFTVNAVKSAVSKEQAMLQFMQTLVKMHNDFNGRMDEFRQLVGTTQGPQGMRGERGPQGPQVDVNSLISLIESRIRTPKDGKDGETPKKGVHYFTPKDIRDFHAHITKLVMAGIKQPKDGKDATVDIDAIIEKIKKGKHLKSEHVDGLAQTISAFRTQLSRGYLHGAGITSLDQGTGIVITPNGKGGYVITATGGGFTTLPATEVPDGSRTVFTFASATAQPSFIISDNAMQRAVTASGDVNWTWNNALHQATMTIPPQDDIIGIK